MPSRLSARERFHVDALIRGHWQTLRLKRVEARIYRALLEEGASPEDIDLDIRSDSPTSKLWRRITGMLAGFDRAHHRSERALERLEERRNRDVDDLREAVIDECKTPLSLDYPATNLASILTAGKLPPPPAPVPLSQFEPLRPPQIPDPLSKADREQLDA